jgi:ComF family protein
MNGMRELRIAVGRAGARAQTWPPLLLKGGLDFLFPPLCVACGGRVSEVHALCSSCWQSMAFVEGALCACCGLPFEIDPGEGTVCGGCYAKPPRFQRARSLVHYDEASKGLILAFKYGDRLDRAPAFARWLERVGRPLLEDADLIVPVPLHRWRLWRRRYNQSAILAQHLAKAAGKPFTPFVLERARATPSQGSMPSAKARRRNMLGPFRVPKDQRDGVRNRNILLVDDVFTTGATLESCARALQRAGAGRIDALTLARVVRPASDTI